MIHQRLSRHLRHLTRPTAFRTIPRLAPPQCRTYTSINSSITTPPAPNRPHSNPLAKHLSEAIRTTGAIPIAAYMRQCLTSEAGGYYTTGEDPFGRKGDFITSPEISQLFGEMVGLWVVTEWMKQGRKPAGLQMIELGPGRGTLMDDVMRTVFVFPKLLGAIDGIFLIEASGPLRETQARLLCGPDVVLNQLPDGSHTATSPKYGNKPVVWYDTLASVPKAESPFILAHEFFDALPIHAFEATSQGWRELLVSPAPANTEPTMPGGAMPEFALTRSEAATPYAILLPEMSVRYKALKKREGTVVEISPESLKVAEEISKRIGRTRSGAALIMDYGPLVDVPAHSLRGIRSHEMVSPFSHPGEVDLSADVDFHALAERALMVSDGVEVHGPVEQGAFLLNMGIGERFDRLVKGKEEEAIKNLKTGFERLVERDGGAMGKVYKAMAIVPERAGVKPVGFGGDV